MSPSAKHLSCREVCINRIIKRTWLRCLIQLSIGDCAELFDYCSQDMIEAKVKLLLQMSLVLIWGTNKSAMISTNQKLMIAKQVQTSLSSVLLELLANSPSSYTLETTMTILN